MAWHVDGQPSDETFDTEGAAVARAWELTPAGGKRPVVRQVLIPADGDMRVSRKQDGKWVDVGHMDVGGVTMFPEKPPRWLVMNRPTSIRGSEGGLVMDVQARAYKENLPDFLRDDSVLATVVWEHMERKIRDSFGPDTARATIERDGIGWVSHTLDEVVDSGAVSFRRRFKVTYDDE